MCSINFKYITYYMNTDAAAAAASVFKVMI